MVLSVQIHGTDAKVHIIFIDIGMVMTFISKCYSITMLWIPGLNRKHCEMSRVPWPVSRTSQCCSVTFSCRGETHEDRGPFRTGLLEIPFLWTWYIPGLVEDAWSESLLKKKKNKSYCTSPSPSFWNKNHRGFKYPSNTTWGHCPRWPGKSPTWHPSAHAPNLWNSGSTGRAAAGPWPLGRGKSAGSFDARAGLVSLLVVEK